MSLHSSIQILNDAPEKEAEDQIPPKSNEQTTYLYSLINLTKIQANKKTDFCEICNIPRTSNLISEIGHFP
jgi:hypothetical protein